MVGVDGAFLPPVALLRGHLGLTEGHCFLLPFSTILILITPSTVVLNSLLAPSSSPQTSLFLQGPCPWGPLHSPHSFLCSKRSFLTPGGSCWPRPTVEAGVCFHCRKLFLFQGDRRDLICCKENVNIFIEAERTSDSGMVYKKCNNFTVVLPLWIRRKFLILRLQGLEFLLTFFVGLGGFFFFQF